MKAFVMQQFSLKVRRDFLEYVRNLNPWTGWTWGRSKRARGRILLVLRRLLLPNLQRPSPRAYTQIKFVKSPLSILPRVARRSILPLALSLLELSFTMYALSEGVLWAFITSRARNRSPSPMQPRTNASLRLCVRSVVCRGGGNLAQHTSYPSTASEVCAGESCGEHTGPVTCDLWW